VAILLNLVKFVFDDTFHGGLQSCDINRFEDL